MCENAPGPVSMLMGSSRWERGGCTNNEQTHQQPDFRHSCWMITGLCLTILNCSWCACWEMQRANRRGKPSYLTGTQKLGRKRNHWMPYLLFSLFIHFLYCTTAYVHCHHRWAGAGPSWLRQRRCRPWTRRHPITRHTSIKSRSHSYRSTTFQWIQQGRFLKLRKPEKPTQAPPT